MRAGRGRVKHGVKPHEGGFQARAPIGSHAGSIVAGSPSALRYSSGSMAFGTATSNTYWSNQSSAIVK